MDAQPTRGQGVDFAAALTHLMQSRRITQAELSRALGVHDTNIRRWRTGHGIEYASVVKIADYFGVDRAELLQLAGYRDSDPTVTSAIEQERLQWQARYDDLIEKRVPRAMWQAYLDACLALADAFRLAASGTVSKPDGGAVSTHQPKKGRRGAEPRNRTLEPFLRSTPARYEPANAPGHLLAAAAAG